MTDINSFNERIGRINKGAQWVPEGVVHQPSRRRKSGRHRSPVARLFGLFTLPMCLSLGLLSLLVARWGRFALMGLQPPELDMAPQTLAIDAGVALAICFLLAQITGLKSVKQLCVAALGLSAGLLGLHLLVHRAPESFSQLFTPEWVAMVTTSTDPNSPLFMSLSALPF